ncbi:MAG: hypothetical protein ACPGRC_07765 [Salibacteraceae bacterium]
MIRVNFIFSLLLLISFTGISQDAYDLTLLESVFPKTLNGCKLENEKQSKFLETKEMTVALVYGLYKSKKLIIEVSLFDYLDSKNAYSEATKVINDVQNSDSIEIIELEGKKGFLQKEKQEEVQYLKLKWKDRYFLVLEVSGKVEKEQIIKIIQELELSRLN